MEAGDDQIVSEASKTKLRLELKNAETIKLDGIGHGLLLPTLAETMLTWLAKQ